MGSLRTVWHVLLMALLGQHAPRRFQVRSEVPLSTEPLRADCLLRSEGAGTKIAMDMHDLEGFDEVLLKLIAKLPPEQVLAAYEPEQRVAGLPPEQRVAGLTFEQRVAGLTSEERLLTLPDEMLRGFSNAYLDTLSEATRAAIRARIGR